MEKLNTNLELLAFKTKYQRLSKLLVPISYLKSSEVYVIKDKSKMIAGFVLGKKAPYRTTDVFVSDEKRKQLPSCFREDTFCEVCCFWIDRAYRKKPIQVAKIWMQMANTVNDQKKETILCGTALKGLAKIYGYPKVSLLYLKDCIQGNDTFVFLARRKDFAIGVKEVVRSRLKKKVHYRDFKNKLTLKTKIFNDLSI